MTSLLPAPAEQYLRSLEKALWPLGSDEREAILLELRGHLAGCSAQGPDRLADALKSLGTPDECARAFVVEGAGDTYRRAGMPGRSIVPLAPPPEFARTPEGLSVRETLAQVQATFRASRNEYWAIGALLVTVLTATNFLSYIHALRPGIIAEIWPIMLLRGVVVIAALAAAYRGALTEDQPVWTVNLATFKFGGGLVVLTIVTVGAVLALMAGAKPVLAQLPSTAAAVAKPLLILLLLALLSSVYLRLQPWLVALAIGRSDVTLAAALRGTKGKALTIVKAWAVLVLPLYILHFALTAAALGWKPIGPLHLGLAGIDGIASMAVAISAALLNATVFRWVTHEPIPPARAFNPELPNEKYVDEARARLRMHIEARTGGLAR